MWFHIMFGSKVWNSFKVWYSTFSLRNTLLRLNWMPAFLKKPWSNTRNTLCVIWENNLETFEKLLSMTQSRCIIYRYFLKPLLWNIHELWHQALMIMKITVEDFEKIVKAPRFLHHISISWLVLKIRLYFDTCRILCA